MNSVRFHSTDEGIHTIQVQFSSSCVLQIRQDIRDWDRFPVGSFGCHRIEDISYRYNPADQGNFISLETVGVARPVQPFMVTDDGWKDRLEGTGLA